MKGTILETGYEQKFTESNLHMFLYIGVYVTCTSYLKRTFVLV